MYPGIVLYITRVINGARSIPITVDGHDRAKSLGIASKDPMYVSHIIIFSEDEEYSSSFPN